MSWKYCNDIAPFGVSIFTISLNLLVFLFAWYCCTVFVYNLCKLGSDSKLNKRIRCQLIATILFLGFGTLGTFVQTTMTQICPEWKYLEGIYSEGPQDSILSGFEGLGGMCYGYGLCGIYNLFCNRIIHAFKGSLYKIPDLIVKLLKYVSIIQVFWLSVGSILFGISNGQWDTIPYIIVSLFFGFYVVCCIFLLTLFLQRLKMSMYLFSSLTDERTPKAVANSNSDSISTNPNDMELRHGTLAIKESNKMDVASRSNSKIEYQATSTTTTSTTTTNNNENKVKINIDNDVNRGILAVMTRTYLLVSIALGSSLLSSILSALAGITNQNYYFTVYLFSYITFDCLINIICVALQFDQNSKYYTKYCQKCHDYVENQCILKKVIDNQNDNSK